MVASEHRLSLAALAGDSCSGEDAADAVTAQEFREALSNALTPVTVVTTDGPGGRAGVTCSAVCSVCDTPPTILVCINRKSYTNAVIKANGVLCVNWLRAEDSDVSQVFAGAGSVPMSERFDPSRWGRLVTGAPEFRRALVALDCRIAEAMEIGTRTVLLARVVSTAMAPHGPALAYVRRSYASAHPALA
jgi:flavin reductase (DIM6/NTAB) family NADH-FMN oxidoreductase RutF